MELWYPELFLKTSILRKGGEIVEVNKKREKKDDKLKVEVTTLKLKMF